MVKKFDNNLDEQTLTKVFRAASKELVQNLEIAALMGQGGEQDESMVLAGGVYSQLGYTETKAYRSKKKKRDKRFWDWVVLETIRQTSEYLEEIIAFHQEQMDRLAEQIEKILQQFNQLEFERLILEEELDKFQKAGFFDLDEQGRLKNTKAEKIIQAWEKKTGRKIDRANPESYGEILGVMSEMEFDMYELQGDLDLMEEKLAFHEEKYKEALEIKNDLESNNPAEVKNAIARMKRYEEEDFKPSEKISVEKSTPESKNQLDEQMDFQHTANEVETNRNTALDDFSFGFPPLQNEFKTASGGESKNDAPLIQSEPNKPMIQKNTPILKL